MKDGVPRRPPAGPPRFPPRPEPMPPAPDPLDDFDRRHSELLDQLEELNLRIEAALAQVAGSSS